MPLATFFNLPEEKRNAILDCAIREFAAHEYDSASISRIVSEAGIAKGSFYQYFSDKSELYRYLLQLASEKKNELMAQASAAQPNLDFFTYLRWLFQEMARFQLLYPELAKIAYRATYGESPLPEGLLASARQSTVQFFRRLIEQGKQRGEIRQEVDTNTCAFMITAIFNELGSFLASRAGMDAGEIANHGVYPTNNPAIQQAYEQLISILQHGTANNTMRTAQEQ